MTLKATGWAPKVTIKDLVVVESNLEPTYFDNEDNDDSQEEISEGKSSHKPRKIKSGKAAKSSEISVKNPKHWPHYFVPGQISDHKDTEYKDLTMAQFVAGYCSIIVHLISRHENLTAQGEIVHRLRHLNILHGVILLPDATSFDNVCQFYDCKIYNGCEVPLEYKLTF